jgi:hypothetical protein
MLQQIDDALFDRLGAILTVMLAIVIFAATSTPTAAFGDNAAQIGPGALIAATRALEPAHASQHAPLRTHPLLRV